MNGKSNERPFDEEIDLPGGSPPPLRARPVEIHLAKSYQQRVGDWMIACFGEMIAGDREERNWRFLEEAAELVQALGASREEAHRLVDYVFDRPEGEPAQEVGGVMVTLAALCLANGLDMHEAGEVELRRVWEKIDKIRAKHAAKPVGIRTPLPGNSETPDRCAAHPDERMLPGVGCLTCYGNHA